MKMPFKSICCCPQHDKWGYGSVGVNQLCMVNSVEESFCKAGNWSNVGHKERKRKICLFCRQRLLLKNKCERLEVRKYSWLQRNTSSCCSMTTHMLAENLFVSVWVVCFYLFLVTKVINISSSRDESSKTKSWIKSFDFT